MFFKSITHRFDWFRAVHRTKKECGLTGRNRFTLLVSALLIGCGTSSADSSRPITVWLIPGEEAEARTVSSPSSIVREIKQFNDSLAGGMVRVLNTQPPLDAQLIVWNEAFAVPNWAWVKNQKETILALQRFAKRKSVRINIRFVTWDRAFADLNLPRTSDAINPSPDVVQIGTTWAAYFASRRLLVSRSNPPTGKGAWEPVLGLPAAVLPYINDVRLLFYWRRLPSQAASAPELLLNTSTWETILSSLREHGGPEDRLAFAGGLTLNLMMDYAMLVWAGGGEMITTSGWRNRADLTSDNALLIPRLLARAAKGENGRHLVAVPESSHQALDQSFVAGEYRITIEPANFVSRWKKDFDKTYGMTKGFWDYAAAGVPPQPFRGGSYLAVMPSPDLPPDAFDLAEFLATDEDYTTVLARNGHLPSLKPGYGMNALLEWLGTADAQEAARFAIIVQQATLQGKSLPDLRNWPTEVESIDVQEALQRVWRRIGEGNLPGLEREAKNAEDVLNAKIDRVSQVRGELIRFGWLAVPVACAFLILAWRNHQRVVRALEHVRRIRGFSASALLTLDRFHATYKRYSEVSLSLEEGRKRSIIAAGINGWRRGRNPDSWKTSSIEKAIWRAVLFAFDIEREADLYEKWEDSCNSNPSSPREFLESTGRLRKNEESADSSRTFYFRVTAPAWQKVETPFLFEQALTCLIQNAIRAADRECEDNGPRKMISIVADPNCVTITNPGQPVPAELRALVNNSKTPEEFEARVLRAVRSAGDSKPGIGLSEAYTIASQCYGGLRIADDRPAVSLFLRHF